MTAGKTFLTHNDVKARYSIGRTTLWRWCKDESLKFPSAVQIGTSLRWKLSDLEAWEQAQSYKEAA